MPVFTKEGYSILYIHIPKTGGSTIESVFKQSGFDITHLDTGGVNSLNYLRKCSPQHFHKEILMSIFDIERFDFVFATIRNPIARIKSEFLMRNRGIQSDIELWIEKALKIYQTNEYVYDNHIRPQSDFLLPESMLFRQEDGFYKDWREKVESEIPFKLYAGETNELNRKKMDGIGTADIQLSSKTIDELFHFYQRDFEYLGYEV